MGSGPTRCKLLRLKSIAGILPSGIVAIADQAAGRRLGLLNDRLYRLARDDDSGIVDVVGGVNSLSFCGAGCAAAAPVTVTVTGTRRSRGTTSPPGWAPWTPPGW